MTHADDWSWDPIDEAMVPRTVTERVTRWARKRVSMTTESPVVSYGHTVFYADGTKITVPTVFQTWAD